MPGEIKKFEVISVVRRHFFIVPGALRACTDFCDPTAVSGLNEQKQITHLSEGISMRPFGLPTISLFRLMGTEFMLNFFLDRNLKIWFKNKVRNFVLHCLFSLFSGIHEVFPSHSISNSLSG